MNNNINNKKNKIPQWLFALVVVLGIAILKIIIVSE